MTKKYWLASLVVAASLLAPSAARAELVCVTTYTVYQGGGSDCHEVCSLYNPDGSYAGRIRYPCAY